MLWLDPMPIPEDIGLAYRGYYTHGAEPDGFVRRVYRKLRSGYLASRLGYREAQRSPWWRVLGRLAGLVPHVGAQFAFSAMWLRANPGGALLEIGSGRGDQLQLFQTLGWQADGLDFDAAAVDAARRRGLRVMHGPLKNQDVPSGRYDAVVMSHVIEHLFDPAETVRECLRVLRPGGTLVVVTPNSSSFGRRHFQQSWLALDPPRHLMLFRPDNLGRLVRSAGFSQVRWFTSMRNGNWVMGASAQIRRHGKFEFGNLPLTLRLYGLLLMYFEWLLLAFRKDAGEEIVLIATR